MVGSNTVRIPKPLDWQAFERDCLVLFQCIWQDENAQRHGRTGQPQCGIDIYGQRNGAGPYIGVQCKLKEDGKEVGNQELRDEIEKCKGFEPAVAEFVLVTTAPDDAKILETVRLINEENGKEGINLKVAVWGWGKLETEIHKYESALDAFDPESSPRIKNALHEQKQTLGDIQGTLKQVAQQQLDVTDLLIESGVSQALAASLPDFLLQAAISTDLPLPPRYFNRTAVNSSLNELLQNNRAAILSGSTGTGKTTTAIGYALYGAVAKNWGIIDLRNKASSEVKQTLSHALHLLSLTKVSYNFILDDLNARDDISAYERELQAILKLQDQFKNHTIITTNSPFPARLQSSLAISESALFTVPNFEQTEIEAYLQERGCKDSADMWSGIILLQTAVGHPQLVHAHIAALEMKGFPQPSANDLLKQPDAVADAKVLATRFIGQLSDPIRQLLYRASLATHSVTKKQLMSLCEVAPPISEPGQAITEIIGPWLEKTEGERLRISPLINGVGKEVNGDAWAEKMHEAIAFILLKQRTLQPIEVNAILFHSVLGKTASPLVWLYRGLTNAENKVWQQIAEWSGWFSSFALEPFKLTEYFGNKYKGIPVPIRCLQYKLALAGDQKNILKITECFDQEFPPGNSTEEQQYLRMLFLTQLLITPPKDITAESLVKYVAEYISIAKIRDEALPQKSEWPEWPTEIQNHGPVAALTGSSLIANLDDKVRYEGFLSAVEKQNPTQFRPALEMLGDNEYLSEAILNRFWLTEWQSSSPDWEKIKELLERTIELAKKFSLPVLGQQAIKILARVINEQFKNPKGALEFAESQIYTFGDSPSLQVGRANIKKSLGDYGGALDLWEKALPQWRLEDDTFAISIEYVHAAFASANADNWKRCAELLTLGAEIKQPEIRKAGMLMDAGFAYWKAGAYQESAANIIAGLLILEKFEDKFSTNPYWTVSKRAGHTVMWLASSAAGKKIKEEFCEPPAACCSNLEDAPLGDGIVTPMEHIYVQLLEFLSEYSLEEKLPESVHLRLRQSQSLTIQVFYSVNMADFALKRADHLRYLGLMVEMAKLQKLLVPYKDENTKALLDRRITQLPSLYAADVDLVKAFMLSVCVFDYLKTGNINLSLNACFQIAEVEGLKSNLEGFLKTAEDLFVKNSDAANLLRTANSWAEQALAALKICAYNEVDPSLVFQSQVILARSLKAGHVTALSLQPLIDLYIMNWRYIIKERAGLLIAPKFNCRLIEEACEDNSNGWPKIFKILTAVRYAVTLPPDSSFIDEFLNMLSK